MAGRDGGVPAEPGRRRIGACGCPGRRAVHRACMSALLHIRARREIKGRASRMEGARNYPAERSRNYFAGRLRCGGRRSGSFLFDVFGFLISFFCFFSPMVPRAFVRGCRLDRPYTQAALESTTTAALLHGGGRTPRSMRRKPRRHPGTETHRAPFPRRARIDRQ